MTTTGIGITERRVGEASSEAVTGGVCWWGDCEICFGIVLNDCMMILCSLPRDWSVRRETRAVSRINNRLGNDWNERASRSTKRSRLPSDFAPRAYFPPRTNGVLFSHERIQLLWTIRRAVGEDAPLLIWIRDELRGGEGWKNGRFVEVILGHPRTKFPATYHEWTPSGPSWPRDAEACSRSGRLWHMASAKTTNADRLATLTNPLDTFPSSGRSPLFATFPPVRINTLFAAKFSFSNRRQISSGNVLDAWKQRPNR